MLKFDELHDPNSCLSRAYADEMIFTLLARDSAAPVAIRAWVTERVRLGKNLEGDAQIREALQCAKRMEEQLGSGVFRKYSARAKERGDSPTLIGVLQIVRTFLSDVAEDPTRLARAQELAERQIRVELT